MPIPLDLTMLARVHGGVARGGGAGNDTLGGTETSDLLSGYGGEGHDYLASGAGEDTMVGSEGDDTIFGGAGDDLLAGDALFYHTTRDTSQPGDAPADDQIYGGDGEDQIDGNGGNDTLWGDAGHDELRGMSGDDVPAGGLGNDVLYGGDGNDTLTGGADMDMLQGGRGDDVLNGGWDDVYKWSPGDGNDTIRGYRGEEGNSGDLIIDTPGSVIITIEEILAGLELGRVIATDEAAATSLFRRDIDGGMDDITVEDGRITFGDQVLNGTLTIRGETIVFNNIKSISLGGSSCWAARG